MYLKCDICEFCLSEKTSLKTLIHHGDACPVCLQDNLNKHDLGQMRERYDDDLPEKLCPNCGGKGFHSGIPDDESAEECLTCEGSGSLCG